MSEIRRPRRYALFKRREARELCLPALDSHWANEQQSSAGVPLPADFPFRAKLVGRWYTTWEDLDGADVEELLEEGFRPREAAAIFRALSEMET